MSASDPHPFFGAPPTRAPRPAREVKALRGKRVVLSTPGGFVSDMRAISEMRTDGDAQQVVEVVTEEGYFRWMFTGERPASRQFPEHLVWIE